LQALLGDEAGGTAPDMADKGFLHRPWRQAGGLSDAGGAKFGIMQMGQREFDWPA
jgi:hypothetical protein